MTQWRGPSPPHAHSGLSMGPMTGYLQERIDLRVFLTIPESRTRVPPLGVGDPERRRLSGPWE